MQVDRFGKIDKNYLNFHDVERIWKVIPIGLKLDVRVETQTQIWPIQML